MADFSARFTGGVTLESWQDPPSGVTLPSRINPSPLHPLKYRRGIVGEQIELRATVGGTEGPADGALGGRLFLCWFAEHPTPRPSISHPPGTTSVRRFTPTVPGHYTIVFRRQRGGGVILHVDVEAA